MTMSHSEPPAKTSRSQERSVSDTGAVDSFGFPLRLFSSNPISSVSVSSASCSSVHYHSTHFPLQQSLLVLIHLHYLRRLIKFSTSPLRPCAGVHTLNSSVSTFFKQVGYVSRHFFESALLATKVFFQTNTFRVFSKYLPQLRSYASSFGADMPSVFVHQFGTFNAEEFLSYSNVISGLDLFLENHNDLEFLNKSSLFFPRLKQLDVHVHSFISIGFFELLNTNAPVTRIRFSSGSIGDEGVKALSEALKVNVTVTDVDLTSNYIGHEGARALADALKVNSAVTSVDLSMNSIGYEGARALAEALKVNNVVTSVDLRYNNIGDEGARALAEALKVNNVVTKVNLRDNSIGADGARSLAEALKVNGTVTGIDLFRNSIGDEGARALAEALKVNNVVTKVNLRDNSIGDEGVRALVDALQVNTTVYLRMNSIGDEDLTSLSEAFGFKTTVRISFF
ncbi:hypothetical protein GEMRC1_010066 [Eukaryota sp. GEM-RC1]